MARRSPASAVPFGRFDVLGRLGIGGMGEVFRARLRDAGGGDAERELALKLLRPDFAAMSHYRDMFTAEARVGSLLHHPNIVRMYEAGEIEGVLYLACELIDGTSLDRISSAGPLPVGVAVHVAMEVLAALAHAHELLDEHGRPLRIVHRDVSASNVLVSEHGRIKLTDFGLAKIAGLSLTMTNEVKGKRAYMAPEQLAGGAMDCRVDVFAMGVLLHELMTGSRPFTEVTDWAREGGRIHGTPFDAVIERALALDPEERFPSARAMAAELARFRCDREAAREVLGARARRAQEAQRPLGKFDQLFLDELAGALPSSISKALSESTISSAETVMVRAPSPAYDLDPHDDELAPPPVAVPAPAPRAPDAPRALDAPHAPDAPRALAAPHAPDAPRSHVSPWRKLAIASFALTVGTVAAVVVNSRACTPAPTQTAAIREEPRLEPRVEPASGTVAMTSPPTTSPPTTSSPTTSPPPKRASPPAPRETRSEPVRRASSERTSRPAVARDAPGYLVLDTDPWATVYLDRRRLGTTPLRVSLPAGKHVLLLDPGSRGRSRSVDVSITSGRERRMSVRLK